jgi:hypothetical protein
VREGMMEKLPINAEAQILAALICLETCLEEPKNAEALLHKGLIHVKKAFEFSTGKAVPNG